MRLTLTLIATLAPLAATAAGKDCRSANDIAAAQARIDGTLQAIARDPGERQAKLGTVLKARADAHGWSPARQDELLKQVTSSPTFLAFEDEKLPHVKALTQAVLSSSGPDAQTTKCQAARETAALARRLGEVSERQYRHATQEIERVAGAAR